jgi:hypothetical protein
MSKKKKQQKGWIGAVSIVLTKPVSEHNLSVVNYLQVVSANSEEVAIGIIAKNALVAYPDHQIVITLTATPPEQGVKL